ncbi:hypothetical protein PG993_003023 [Apiospora rasikravindrae]|uniref:GH16 domain-containing protein n=1 Tax=Apiospora rasikravindrae TaxID=990691 RepID=A0ABR1TYI4_9PEZI
MTPDKILGYSLLWYDSFRSTEDVPYHKWNATVNQTHYNNEVQRYDSAWDVTHIHSIFGGPEPHVGDSMYITPQLHDGEWRSARMEGKSSYSCPEGKSLILQANIQVGSAPSDKQAGIWPAFWALGESQRHGTEWPLCGEWDIFETSDGHDWTLGSLHWGEMNADRTIGRHSLPPAVGDELISKYGNKYDHTQPHTWSIKVDRTKSSWRDETIQWFMDGKQFYEVKGSDVNNEEQWGVLAHEPYFPVLNVAVGGTFPKGGQPNAQTATGMDTGMTVQYVAFYLSD